MPWSEISPMNQRVRFIADYHYRLLTVAELCSLYGVSRKTGYKWIERFRCDGALVRARRGVLIEHRDRVAALHHGERVPHHRAKLIGREASGSPAAEIVAARPQELLLEQGHW